MINAIIPFDASVNRKRTNVCMIQKNRALQTLKCAVIKVNMDLLHVGSRLDGLKGKHTLSE